MKTIAFGRATFVWLSNYAVLHPRDRHILINGAKCSWMTLREGRTRWSSRTPFKNFPVIVYASLALRVRRRNRISGAFRYVCSWPDIQGLELRTWKFGKYVQLCR